jgi:hypothetical protein
MRAHHVLDVDAAVEVLVGLDVRVVERGANVVPVVGFGKEAGRAQDDDRQVVIQADELAEILGRGLRDAVDVAGHRYDLLGDPRCRRAG